MKFEDAVKIVHPDKYDEWWKGVDKDKDYQKKTDKLLDKKELDEAQAMFGDCHVNHLD